MIATSATAFSTAFHEAAHAPERIEKARWALELPYFRWLHEQLPEPFFHTQAFLLFLLVVAVAYWTVPRRMNTARVWLLVIASFHFYAAWNASLALLVTGTTIADFFLAQLIDRGQRPRVRKLLLFASVGMNLGILCYFKYRGFFLNELHDLVGRVGFDAGYRTLSPLDIIVPFGISFYTFEAISYAVDVYRRKIRAERSLPHFLLFILFFPHLVAGPIVRAGDFLWQAHRVKRWNWLRVQVGLQLFLLGVFKKLAIADRMAVFTDGTGAQPGPFLMPELHNTSSLWLAAMAYALRIYCDFSGYSDMALGIAHLFGFKLTQNFNMPYLAANVSEFWRRWHISLSTWLRDYVFIPLGGSRAGAWVTNRNLMITMILGGLWHGANWTYVVWGLLHGLLLVIHRQFRAWSVTKPKLEAALNTWVGTAARVGLTFACVTLCWVFFRPECAKSITMLQRMFGLYDGLTLPLHNRSLWYTVLFVLLCHLLVARGLWQKFWERAPAAVLGVGYAVCLTVAMVLAPDGGKTFIYFTF
ncbi:MBOAT family O-acyltransferase [Limnoglobus roseus]|uniref:MBOAT family protein n=1 Tax=Limnoglobus roseus TaxID=2598579 RepID=A0A5C1A2F7_9BACT|nr:MBOAT family protein [Limnoglobus roseus]QEL13299.1 MBOAT family protein [Limnoglobus roseus]